MLEEPGIFLGQGAVDFKTRVRPAAYPAAEMKIRVTGVAVAHKGFVMAAAGTEGARPAGVTIQLSLDVAAIQKGGLFLLVDAGSDVSQHVLVGIDETVAWRDVTGRPHADEPETSSAGMRLVHALVEFRERVADVGKAVEFAAQRELQVFLRELAKLREHIVHAGFVDGVQAVRGSGHRSKAYFVKAQIVFQMAVDL